MHRRNLNNVLYIDIIFAHFKRILQLGVIVTRKTFKPSNNGVKLISYMELEGIQQLANTLL